MTLIETIPHPAAATETHSEEFSSLNSVQKLARLLLMLAPENASQILKGLGDEQVEEVSSEMLKITSISQELQEEILREFSPVAVEAAAAIVGGITPVQQLLDKSVGPLRASDIIGRVSPLRAPVAAMQQFIEMEPRHLWNLLRDEQLQTAVLVISYLPESKASHLLSLMRPDLREQIIERLASLSPTSIEVVECLAESLQRKAGTNRVRGSTQTGGVKVAAQLLNALPKDVSKNILTSLRERNPDLADSVSKKMFTFEELEYFDPKTIQKILQTVDTHSLAVSLKTASESLKAKLIAGLTRRAGENLLEEIGLLGPLRLTEIDVARSSIIDVIKQLDADGEIEMDEARRAARN